MPWTPTIEKLRDLVSHTVVHPFNHAVLSCSPYSGGGQQDHHHYPTTNHNTRTTWKRRKRQRHQQQPHEEEEEDDSDDDEEENEEDPQVGDDEDEHEEDPFVAPSSCCPTLDLVPDSPIVTLTLGASHTVVLRPKRYYHYTIKKEQEQQDEHHNDHNQQDQQQQPHDQQQGEKKKKKEEDCGGNGPSTIPTTTSVELPHGSILYLGPRTNRLMTHQFQNSVASSGRRRRRGMQPKDDDDDNDDDDDDEETAHCHSEDEACFRICITFRHVATFQQTNNGILFGRGATEATLDAALQKRQQEQEQHQQSLLAARQQQQKQYTTVQAMHKMFELETKYADFDRVMHYSHGFDILPFDYVSSSPVAPTLSKEGKVHYGLYTLPLLENVPVVDSDDKVMRNKDNNNNKRSHVQDDYYYYEHDGGGGGVTWVDYQSPSRSVKALSSSLVFPEESTKSPDTLSTRTTTTATDSGFGEEYCRAVNDFDEGEGTPSRGRGRRELRRSYTRKNYDNYRQNHTSDIVSSSSSSLYRINIEKPFEFLMVDDANNNNNNNHMDSLSQLEQYDKKKNQKSNTRLGKTLVMSPSTPTKSVRLTMHTPPSSPSKQPRNCNYNYDNYNYSNSRNTTNSDTFTSAAAIWAHRGGGGGGHSSPRHETKYWNQKHLSTTACLPHSPTPPSPPLLSLSTRAKNPTAFDSSTTKPPPTTTTTCTEEELLLSFPNWKHEMESKTHTTADTTTMTCIATRSMPDYYFHDDDETDDEEQEQHRRRRLFQWWNGDNDLEEKDDDDNDSSNGSSRSRSSSSSSSSSCCTSQEEEEDVNQEDNSDSSAMEEEDDDDHDETTAWMANHVSAKTFASSTVLLSAGAATTNVQSSTRSHDVNEEPMTVSANHAQDMNEEEEQRMTLSADHAHSGDMNEEEEEQRMTRNHTLSGEVSSREVAVTAQPPEPTSASRDQHYDDDDEPMTRAVANIAAATAADRSVTVEANDESRSVTRPCPPAPVAAPFSLQNGEEPNEEHMGLSANHYHSGEISSREAVVTAQPPEPTSASRDQHYDDDDEPMTRAVANIAAATAADRSVTVEANDESRSVTRPCPPAPVAAPFSLQNGEEPNEEHMGLSANHYHSGEISSREAVTANPPEPTFASRDQDDDDDEPMTRTVPNIAAADRSVTIEANDESRSVTRRCPPAAVAALFSQQNDQEPGPPRRRRVRLTGMDKISWAQTTSDKMQSSAHNKKSVASNTSVRRSLRKHKHNNGIALLAVDLQNDYLGDEDSSFFLCQLGSSMAPRRAALLQRIGELADQVRNEGGVVFWVKSHYGAWTRSSLRQNRKRNQPTEKRAVDNGLYEITSSSSMTTTTSDDGACCNVSSLGAEFHPDVSEQIIQDGDQDVILVKEWYSAFMGTTLHGQLQRLQVGHVVVCGVTTNHSVAATVRSASNYGYNVIVSSDGTAQIDENHQTRTLAGLQKYYSILLDKGEELADVVIPNSCYGVKPTNSSEEGERGAGQDDQSTTSVLLEFDPIGRLSGLGAGDSVIVPGFLETTWATELFQNMIPGSLQNAKEGGTTEWGVLPPGNDGTDGSSSMLAHTAFQMEPNENGHVPAYRRCNDPQLWDPDFQANFPNVVQGIKSLAESQTGHHLNFGLIECHNGNNDSNGWNQAINNSIPNQLDIRSGSFVAAVCLGGDRILELRPKTTKDTSSCLSQLAPQRIHLEHNSLVLLGPETTRLFLHRVVLPPSDGSASTSPHIQFTFLDVATFYANQKKLGVPILYGQGTEYSSYVELGEAEATCKSVEQLGIVTAGIYTLSRTVLPGRPADGRRSAAGSFGLTFICTLVVTAGTAFFLQQERRTTWKDRPRRMWQSFQDSTDEAMLVEEAQKTADDCE